MGCTGSKSGHGDGALAERGARGKKGKANKTANCVGGYGGAVTPGAHHPKNGNGGNGNGNGNGGGGTAAYCPDDDTAKAYYEQVMALRRVAVAQGLLPAATDHHTGSIDSQRNDNGSLAGSRDPSTAKRLQNRRMTVGDASRLMQPPPRTVTVYQCQPLAGDTTVAKGMYSTVHLARLSVFTGPAEEGLGATVPRYAPMRRGGGTVANNSGSGGAGVDQSSISFSTDVVSQGSPTSNRDPNESAPSPGLQLSGARANLAAPKVNPNPNASTVSLKSTLSSVSVTHYIIAMKEIVLFGNSSAAIVLEQVRQEVRRWTRLSAYAPRLLHCYQLEYVMSEGGSAAVPEAACAYFPGLDNTVGSTAAAAAPAPAAAVEHKKGHSPGAAHLLAGISSRLSNSSPNAAQLESSTGTFAGGAPHKLRLYVEYAKYGTLRGFQVKEMAERFQKQRLHELTARAYMRDVLLALTQLHDAGELQYDLCAKAVFLNKPIQSVYFSFFPAYISDIPTGDLAGVTPSQLGKALGLLDPPHLDTLPPPATGESAVDHRGSRHEPINGAGTPPHGNMRPPVANGAPGPRVTVSSSLQNNANGETANPNNGNGASGAYFTRNGSMLVHDSSCANGLSAIEVGVSNGEQRNGGAATGLTAYERQSGQANGVYSASPLDLGSCESPTAPLGNDTGSRGGLATASSPTKGRGGGSGSYGAGAQPMYNRQTSANSLRTPGTVDADADEHGGSGGGADRPRCLHDAYCRYLDEFDFKRTDDNEHIPFPSPHDGVGAQDDAEMLASTMIAEEPRETPPMRVVPLQRSSLGGIAILSPDHFVVKPVVSPVPDLHGRLPMLLTPDTHRAAFLCGSLQHQRLVTAESSPSAAALATGSSSSPPQHTLNAGTSTSDAAGPLGRCRGGVPLVKLNHTALVRRALNFGDSDRLEDVPVHKYITVTHAAPEVLHRRTFSAASDVYAFAMTFIELVTDDGAIMEDCMPTDKPKPLTRRDKDAYDAALTDRLDKWYQARLVALRQHYDDVAKEQALPELMSPRAGPVVVRIPPHLSDECQNMLRWCLQSDPAKRPTAAELLRSRYFMLGDWIAAPSVVAAEGKLARPPESPWVSSITYDMAARAAGLPALRPK